MIIPRHTFPLFTSVCIKVLTKSLIYFETDIPAKTNPHSRNFIYCITNIYEAEHKADKARSGAAPLKLACLREKLAWKLFAPVSSKICMTSISKVRGRNFFSKNHFFHNATEHDIPKSRISELNSELLGESEWIPGSERVGHRDPNFPLPSLRSSA